MRMRDTMMKMRSWKVCGVTLAMTIAMHPVPAMCQQPASSPMAGATATQVSNLSTPAQTELATLISAGTLTDLHWPNFTDYRADVQKVL